MEYRDDEIQCFIELIDEICSKAWRRRALTDAALVRELRKWNGDARSLPQLAGRAAGDAAEGAGEVG